MAGLATAVGLAGASNLLGVVTGVLTLVNVAIKTTNTVIRFCRGAETIQDDLLNITRELISLQSGLTSVYNCLQTPDPEMVDIEHQIALIMRNCEITIQRLNTCYSQAFPSKPGDEAPWFERGLKHSKLDHMQGELSTIREQIQSHVSAMLLSFSVLNVCQQRRETRANLLNAQANAANAAANQANADALRVLGTRINDLGRCQDRLEATRQQNGAYAASDVRMIDDIEIFRRKSIAIHKAATHEMGQRLSVRELAAVASAASAFKTLRKGKISELEGPNASAKLASSATLGELEGSIAAGELATPPTSSELDASVAPVELDAAPLHPTAGRKISEPEVAHQQPHPEEALKRHMSADDGAPQLAAADGLQRPSFFRTARSFPLLTTTNEPQPATPTMTVEEFEDEMSKTMIAADERRKAPTEPFNDADVDLISSLLTAVGKFRWSERPRTYIVLRLIGEVRAIEGFVLEGLKDVQFPYASEVELPDTLKSEKSRRDFISRQWLVLTPRSAALVTGGRHTHVENADTRFKDIQSLGRGGQGSVDKVTSKLDLQVYARKRIRKPRELTRDKSALKAFENEIHNLKRLNHRHLVNFVGSYTDRKYVGIIMEPVADMDLKDYLLRTPFPGIDLDSLRTFFGCLCSAVRYLHQHSCRHKDLKPANILVKENQVYITDFGLALDWSELPGETTAGPSPMYTHAYAAPEVAAGAGRNTKSDIWSLGCVYLDMLTVLKGRTLDDKKLFMGSRGSVTDVSRNTKGLSGWIEELRTISSKDESPLEWAETMLRQNPQDRPTAASLMDKILAPSERHVYCGSCCCEESELSEQDSQDSFKGSESDDDPGLSTGSYTRSTNVQSDVTGKSNSSMAVGIASPDSISAEWVSGSPVMSPKPLNASEIDAPVATDFLSDILLLSDADLEESLLKTRSSDRAGWTERLSRADAYTSSNNGKSLLHRCAVFKDESLARDIARLLLSGRADPSPADFVHNTPLHYAVASGHAMLVRDLLAKGGHPTNSNLRMRTPLHVAARVGNAAVIKRLLQRCAADDVDLRDDSDRTPLHYASVAGAAETIAALLEKGADPALVDSRGNNTYTLYKESAGRTSQGDVSVSSPAFDDFVEDTATEASPTMNAIPVTLDNDFRVCECEVCKSKKAFEGIPSTEGASLKDYAFWCDEAFGDSSSFATDLAECECGECSIFRNGSGQNADQHDTSNDIKDTAPPNDEETVAEHEQAAADDLPKPDIEPHRSEETSEAVVSLGCTGVDAGCRCPNCKTEYQGHEYWDKRIELQLGNPCRCNDCLQKNTVYAEEVLRSAGLTGKKSYIAFPSKAWLWAMAHASKVDRIEHVVELLLKYNANIETEDGKGLRFLHIAAETGNLALAKTLLDHGAAANTVRAERIFTLKDGFTALTYAVYRVKHEMIRLLLREGFDLKQDSIVAQLIDGETEHDTFPEESQKTLPMLLAHGPDLEREYKGMTALQKAVKLQKVEVASQLLEAGANVDGCTSTEMRPLWRAIDNRYIDLVELLLKYHPDVHEHERNGTVQLCALMRAAFDGCGAVNVVLLEQSDAGKDIDKIEEDGWGVLHWVANSRASDNADAATALMKAGASVTLKATNGDQPLHIAAKTGDFEVTDVLLKNGAEVSATNNDSKTALDLAKDARHKEVVERLGGTLAPKKAWYKRL